MWNLKKERKKKTLWRTDWILPEVVVSTWVQSQNLRNDLCSFPRQAIHITEIHVYAPTINAKEAEIEQFCENLQDLLELTPKNKNKNKMMSFSS